MSEMNTLDFAEVTGLDWPSLPEILSLKVEKLKYEGESVEGVLILKYKFNGTHEASQPFKTKLNEQASLPVGPLTAHFHVWLNGPKLCFGLKICAGPICSKELKTSVDAPH